MWRLVATAHVEGAAVSRYLATMYGKETAEKRMKVTIGRSNQAADWSVAALWQQMATPHGDVATVYGEGAATSPPTVVFRGEEATA